ncbi:MAG: 50S ribosomal protein L33 [Terracidiphilus sp.]
MREIVTLQCTECKERNYSTTVTAAASTSRTRKRSRAATSR